MGHYNISLFSQPETIRYPLVSDYGRIIDDIDDSVDAVIKEPDISLMNDIIAYDFTNYNTLAAEDIFAGLVLADHFKSLSDDVLSLFGDTSIYRLAYSAYKREGRTTDKFNQIYRTEVLKWMTQPVFFIKEDTHACLHISEVECFKQFLRDTSELALPVNRYASAAFINLINRYFADEGNNKPIKLEFDQLGISSKFEDLSTKDLAEMLGRFFTRFTFFEKPRFQEMVLSEIKSFCDKKQEAREFFLDFYEQHSKIFNEAFLTFPEYIFIVQGKYQRYEVIMDLSEKLELTMQDFAHEEKFFSVKNAHTHSTTFTYEASDEEIIKPLPTSKYAFDIKVHQVKLIRSLDRFTQSLIANSTDYQVINFWPNSTLDKKTTKPVGPYIAVAFMRNNRWVLLIDGIYERCAIYVWEGDSLNDGLEIFKINKSYARGQENVKHYNHRGIYEDYDVTYKRIMSTI